MWVPIPGKTAKFRFHATVAINKGNYWKGMVSEEVFTIIYLIAKQLRTYIQYTSVS
jgi:hypothetical protein